MTTDATSHAVDWRPAADAIDRWPISEQSSLTRHLQDNFPSLADVIRRSGSGVISVVEFERAFSGLWGVALINAPAGDNPIPLMVYGASVGLDRESFIKTDDDGLSPASVNFWRQLAGLLGRSLSRGIAH
jgi:hypothetical protein